MIQKPQAVLTEAQVNQAVGWLDQVEQGVDELLAGKPAIADNELDILRGAIGRCKDYAWALKTFPVFDLAGLRIRKLQKAKLRNLEVVHSQKGVTVVDDLEVELSLPAFATIPWGPKGGSYESPIQQLGDWEQNEEAILKALGTTRRNRQVELQLWRVRLEAKCPAPPAAVAKGIEHIKGRFDDLTIGYEAEWAQAPVRDPLILGRIAGTWFLLDEYDASKLERYIASEFSRRPKT